MAKETTKPADVVAEVRAAAQKLIDADRSLRERRDALKRERLSLEGANASKEEVLANVDRVVDQAAVAWSAKFAGSFVLSLSGELVFDGTKPRRLSPRLPNIGDRTGAATFEDLVGMFPEQAKARIRKIVSEVKNVSFGPREADRVRRLAEIEAELESVSREITDVAHAAKAVGITLPSMAEIEQEERNAAARGKTWVVQDSVG